MKYKFGKFQVNLESNTYVGLNQSFANLHDSLHVLYTYTFIDQI